MAAVAGRRFRYDAGRMLRLCVWSALVGTPLGHFWYLLLDKVRCWLPPGPGGHDLRSAARRTAACRSHIECTPMPDSLEGMPGGKA